MSIVAKVRPTGGSGNKRPVHVVSSGKGRNRPAAGLPPKPTSTPPKNRLQTVPGRPSSSAPASRPRPEEATAPKGPPAKGKAEKHAAKRKSDKAERDKARATKAKGITPESIKNDPSLNKEEKKNMMVILEKAKGRHEG